MLLMPSNEKSVKMEGWWSKSILIDLSVTQNNTMINNYHLNTMVVLFPFK